jgi:hypothetical protein
MGTVFSGINFDTFEMSSRTHAAQSHEQTST